MEQKTFDKPDEQHVFDKAVIDVVTVGGVTTRRLTFQPGWNWSESVKPKAGTELCENPHLNIHISGRLGVKMADGTEAEYGPGDVAVVAPKHDAWTIGDEPVVIIEQTPPQ